MRKKVLIITYYWPPSGGIGVLRCLKFAKYLRKYDWEPVVYTAENADYPYYDESNFKDIPEGIQILKQPIKEPFKLFKLLTRRKNIPLNNFFMVRDRTSMFDKFAIWIRANFFIPDARALWIQPSVTFLAKYLKENPVEVIFTDGPPHTNTVIGMKLSKATGIPFVADFQDPWTQVDYYQVLPLMRWADKKHRCLEQDIFKQAKQIGVASPSWKHDLELIGAKNVSVLYYGYDEDDFVNFEVKPDDLFTICHSGILGHDRNPKTFFKVIAELCEEEINFSDHVRIKLIGQVSYEVLESIQQQNLESNVELVGTISRIASLESVTGSWCLLLPINKAENAKGRIPGKFYEYLRTKRPIISLGPNDGDVAQIIDEYKLGKNFEYDQHNGIKEYILQLYKRLFLKGLFTDNHSKNDIRIFSNDVQTESLAKILNQAVRKTNGSTR